MKSLAAVLQAIGKPRVLVFGDVMLDRYTWGDAARISPEAPIPVLRVEDEQVRLGGAGCVASLVAGLGAPVALAGAIGDDASGRSVRRIADELAIDGALLVATPERITTTKHRFIGRAAGRHPHQMLRVDDESTQPVDTAQLDQLLAQVARRMTEFDAVLISDYAKGVCGPPQLRQLIDLATQRNIPCIVDPARIGDYARYRGATLITPNRTEAAGATGIAIDTPEAALAAAAELCRRYGVAAAAVTIDRDGIVVAEAHGTSQHFPCRPCEVCDITGAGDTVLAVIGLALASGASLADAARLANLAAGIQVKRFGAAPILAAELADEVTRAEAPAPQKILSPAQLAARVEDLRSRQKTIVFTNGCFDLLHAGHVRCLQEAAGLGDVLIVAVNSDTSVRQLKGAGRPLMPQAERAAVLAALTSVDYVVVFDDLTPLLLLETIRPDVLVKGGTYQVEDVVGREIVEKYGGRVCTTGVVAGLSTTAIVESMRGNNS